MNTEHKTKVLMLDDEKFLLHIYQISFEKHGYEVVTCTDVDQALSTLRKGYDPEIILFDITMPDSRSGYEFIEAINRERLAGHSLKIALTNQGRYGEITRLGQLGADAHILKAQYIPSELVTKVSEMLNAKRG